MTTSYNGWVASPHPSTIDIAPLVVLGHGFPPGCRAGAVHAVFTELIRRLHTEVEPAGEGCWGYAYRQNRNAANLSCHASGTAIDYNAPKHPNGKRGTWSKTKTAKIRRILADLDVIAWGEDFSGTVDGMHFEIKGTAAQVAAVANRLHHPAPPAPTPEDDVTDADIEKVAQRVRALIAKDLAVLLHGTADGSHPANLDNIWSAVKK